MTGVSKTCLSVCCGFQGTLLVCALSTFIQPTSLCRATMPRCNCHHVLFCCCCCICPLESSKAIPGQQREQCQLSTGCLGQTGMGGNILSSRHEGGDGLGHPIAASMPCSQRSPNHNQRSPNGSTGGSGLGLWAPESIKHMRRELRMEAA